VRVDGRCTGKEKCWIGNVGRATARGSRVEGRPATLSKMFVQPERPVISSAPSSAARTFASSTLSPRSQRSEGSVVGSALAASGASSMLIL